MPEDGLHNVTQWLWFFCEECWMGKAAEVEVEAPSCCNKTMTRIGWFDEVKYED